MPIADQGEDEQQKGNQQQAGGFRGVNRMPLLVDGIVLAMSVSHTDIVRRAGIRARRGQQAQATRRV